MPDARAESGRVAAGCLLSLASIVAAVAGLGIGFGGLRRVSSDFQLDDPRTVAGLAIAGGLLVATLAVGATDGRGPRARRLSGLLFATAALGGGLWFVVRAGAQLVLKGGSWFGAGDTFSTVLDGALGALLLGIGTLVLWTAHGADAAAGEDEG
ncbi:MAG: hypothetical protein L0216_13855 [Planctomycetales bacterium]|nr:hypothetical protein [Planctomycetales bacterium]